MSGCKFIDTSLPLCVCMLPQYLVKFKKLFMQLTNFLIQCFYFIDITFSWYIYLMRHCFLTEILAKDQVFINKICHLIRIELVLLFLLTIFENGLQLKLNTCWTHLNLNIYSGRDESMKIVQYIANISI